MPVASLFVNDFFFFSFMGMFKIRLKCRKDYSKAIQAMRVPILNKNLLLVRNSAFKKYAVSKNQA